MEESESGEKQENTGIGPASACRDSPTPSCVPDAVQREAERSGAPLIRDRHGLERSRVCSAPLRAALRPGHESAATQHSCTIAWSARRTNLRLCEMTAGAISLFWGCYLQ